MAGFCMLQLVQNVWSGCWRELFTGSEVSQRKLPPHSGQTISGNPPGSVGGKASTTMSSTQSAWLQEWQRYLYHLLGLGLNFRNSSHVESVILRFLRYLLKQLIFFNNTVFGMINQFQRHRVTALWAKQRVFCEAVKETLLKRFCRKYPVPSRVTGHVNGNDLSDEFSAFLVSNISMQAVITDSLKTFWQNVLCHTSYEFECRKSFMLNLSCFVVAIPVADGFPVISFNPSNRDGGRDDVLCQIVSKALSAGWHLSGLKESDKSLWIIFPCPINVLFDGRIANIFSDHLKKMILPFPVHQIIRDVRDVLPLSPRVNSAGCHENMKVRVVMAGSSCGLKNDNVSDVEFCGCASLEDIFETGVTCSHERTEQCGIPVKPHMQEIRHCQYDVPISYPRQQTSADEVCPSVCIDFTAGKTEAGLAGEGDASGFTAVAASVLNKAHLVRIAAVEHFLNGVGVFRTVKAWMSLFKRIPVIAEDKLECVFVNAFHGCSLGTTITKSAE